MVDALNNSGSGIQAGMMAGQGQRLEQMRQEYLNPTNADRQKLKKTAQEFEAIFVQQLLEAMDKTVDRSANILGGGSAEEYFRSMMNEEVAKSMSSNPTGSGFGLAESIYRQMEQSLKPNPLAPKDAIQMGQSNEVSG